MIFLQVNFVVKNVQKNISCIPNQKFNDEVIILTKNTTNN